MTPWSLYTLVQLNWIENSILIFIKLNESIEKQQEIKKKWREEERIIPCKVGLLRIKVNKTNQLFLDIIVLLQFQNPNKNTWISI